MTVKTTTNKSGPYQGDGVQTVFPYTYITYEDTHLQVIQTEAGVDTLLVLGDDYTVDGLGNENGGNVTLLVAPTATQTITIVREVPIEQNTRFSNQGGWFPEVHERSFDLLTMIDQQVDLDRQLAIQAPVSDPQGLNYILPPVEAREGLAVTFDAQGNVIVSDLSGPPGPEGPATTQITVNDTTPDFLAAKIALAGDLSGQILNPGANEVLEISYTEPAPQPHVVSVSDNDTTSDYLEGKIAGVGVVEVTVGNEGADETLNIAVNGVWELIETAEITAPVAVVDFVDLDLVTYDTFKIIASDCVPGSDNSAINCRVREEGATWRTGASDYEGGYVQKSGSSGSFSGGNSDRIILLNPVGTAGGESGSFEATFFSFADAGLSKHMFFQSAATRGDGTFRSWEGGAKTRNALYKADGIRIFPESGNMPSGKFRLYGLRT